MLQQRQVPEDVWTDLLGQENQPAEAMERPEGDNLDDEGPKRQGPAKPVTPHRKTRVEHNTNQNEQVDGLLTVREEKDHEMCRQFNRKQNLRWEHENSKRLIEDETMVARVAIPISEEDTYIELVRMTRHL